jgi:hypothetical protein
MTMRSGVRAFGRSGVRAVVVGPLLAAEAAKDPRHCAAGDVSTSARLA